MAMLNGIHIAIIVDAIPFMIAIQKVDCVGVVVGPVGVNWAVVMVVGVCLLRGAVEVDDKEFFFLLVRGFMYV